MEISSDFCQELTDLTASLDADDFRENILGVMNRLLGIAHFAVFVFDRNHIEDLSASMIEGDEQKVLLSKNADLFVKKLKQQMWLNPEQLLEADHQHGEKTYHVYRYSPDEDIDLERRRLYEKTHTREKIFMVISRSNRVYITNFFRGAEHQKLTDQEFEQLTPLFPLFNNLIILHHEISGFDKDNGKIQEKLATLFKERGLAPFSRLSQRETEVCDGILRGMTADAIASDLNLALSSVNTLRKRAYDKIGIATKSQLFALVMNSHF